MRKTTRRNFAKRAAVFSSALFFPGLSLSEQTHPLERKIGRLFCLNMYWRTPPDFFLRMVEKYHVGGAYLSGHALDSDEVCRRAVDRIAGAAAEPMAFTTDAEGGPVNRLRKILPDPGARELGRRLTSGEISEREFYDHYAQKAGAMAGWGFTSNLEPVLDLSGPYIANRSFGKDPGQVAKAGAALVRAYRDQGMATVGKHFPGMRSVRQDPHQAVMPRIPTPLAELRELDLAPFAAAIAAGMPGVMVGHPTVEALDPGLPASVSKIVITDFLKNEMGFKGAVWPDGISMGMIKKHYERRGVPANRRVLQGCLDAIRAGADMVFDFHMHPNGLPPVIRAVRQAVESGDIPESRIDDAAARAEAMRPKA